MLVVSCPRISSVSLIDLPVYISFRLSLFPIVIAFFCCNKPMILFIYSPQLVSAAKSDPYVIISCGNQRKKSNVASSNFSFSSLCQYVYVHMYKYIYIYACTYIYLYAYLYMHVYVYIYAYIPIHAYIPIRRHIRSYTHTQTHQHAYAFT